MVCTPRPAAGERGRRRLGRQATRDSPFEATRELGRRACAHTPRGSQARVTPTRAGRRAKRTPGRQANTRHPSNRVSDDHQHHRPRDQRGRRSNQPRPGSDRASPAPPPRPEQDCQPTSTRPTGEVVQGGRTTQKLVGPRKPKECGRMSPGGPSGLGGLRVIVRDG